MRFDMLGPIVKTDEREREILKVVVEYQLDHAQPTPVTQVLLRFPSEEVGLVQEAIAALVAKGSLESGREATGAALQLTPSGLCSSGLPRASEAARFAENLLGWLKTRAPKEHGGFTNYTWEELRSAGVAASDQDFELAATVIQVFRLSSSGSIQRGAPPGATWSVPSDLAQLGSVTNINGLLDRVNRRDATHAAPEGGKATLPEPMNSRDGFEYDVALSFAGEDRQHAEALAWRLRDNGIRVFYDAYEKATLWGKDLYVHLHQVYSQRARFCVIFASASYAAKLWTSHERQAAQERAFTEKGGEYILPIRLDKTVIPGLPATIGYVSIEDGIDEICQLLLAKLHRSEHPTTAKTHGPQVAQQIGAGPAAPSPVPSTQWIPRRVSAGKVIIVALAAIPLAGFGHLLARWFGQEETALVLKMEDLRSALPSNPPSPRAGAEPAYCGGFRGQLLLAHNQTGTRPLRISRLELQREIGWAEGIKATGECVLDPLKGTAHGIVELRTYLFTLTGNKVQAQYFTTLAPDGAAVVDPANILVSTSKAEAIILTHEGNDAHFQAQTLVQTKGPERYRIRFRATYDVGGESREAMTQWVYVMGMKDDEPSQPQSSLTSGFRTSAELEEIDKLAEQGQLDRAIDAATKLLERPPETFESGKHERFMKATAHVQRAQLLKARRDFDGAIEDLAASAKMGSREGAYLAADLLIALEEAKLDGGQRPLWPQRALELMQMAATLGEPTAMERLRVEFGRQHKGSEREYWFFLARMGDDAQQMADFANLYRGIYNDKHRAMLADVLGAHGLAAGTAAEHGIPARSAPAVAFTDYSLRRRLEFVWRASFAPETPSINTIDRFSQYRKIFAENPFAQPVLIVAAPAKAYPEDRVYSVPSRAELAASVSPGDEIIVRCGALVHQATVWAFDDTKRERVQLLDPFSEFWQPSHNTCISQMSYGPLPHGREATVLSWPEVEKMLTGVISFRDP